MDFGKTTQIGIENLFYQFISFFTLKYDISSLIKFEEDDFVGIIWQLLNLSLFERVPVFF